MSKHSKVSKFPNFILKRLRRELFFLYVDATGYKREDLSFLIDLLSMELDYRLGEKKYKA